MARGTSTTVYLVWSLLVAVLTTTRALTRTPDDALSGFVIGVANCAPAWCAFRGFVLAEVLCFVLAAFYGFAGVVGLIGGLREGLKEAGNPSGPITTSVLWFLLNGLPPIVVCVLFLRETPKMGIRRNPWWPFRRQ